MEDVSKTVSIFFDFHSAETVSTSILKSIWSKLFMISFNFLKVDSSTQCAYFLNQWSEHKWARTRWQNSIDMITFFLRFVELFYCVLRSTRKSGNERKIWISKSHKWACVHGTPILLHIIIDYLTIQLAHKWIDEFFANCIPLKLSRCSWERIRE